MNYPIYIKNANGVYTMLPTPTGLEVQCEDVSDAAAGRTEDVTMHKNRIGRTGRFDISYKNTNTEKVTTALQLVKPQYFTTIYMDLELGGEYVCAPMYRGNVKCTVYNGANDIWSNVAFPIITQKGVEPIVCTETQNLPTTGAVIPDLSALGSSPVCTVVNVIKGNVAIQASTNKIFTNPGSKGVVIASDASDNFIMIYVTDTRNI